MKPVIRFSVFIVVIALTMTVSEQSSWAQEAPEGDTVSINGMQMYYEIYGQGEPVVLLHGFFGSGQEWAPMVMDFAKEFQLIIPDLRGHGHSTNPSKEFTHRQSARDVFALLDHLGIDHFKAMGVSSGGMTLLHMATQQPDRVEAMVLIAATIYFPEQARELIRETTIESLTDQNWAEMRLIHKAGDEQIEALGTQFHHFKDSYDDMNFTTPYLSTITARTLIVHGDRDSFFPVSIPLEMYTAIPNAFLWIVPNGGHDPIFGDMLPQFTQTALAFLGGEWDPR